MKRRIVSIRGWAIAGAIVVVSVVAANLYLRGDAFQSRVQATLAELTNGSVELGDRITITSFLPSLKVSLPNAKLRTQGVLRRARFEGLELDASLLAVLTRGAWGRANLTIARTSLIVTPSTPALARSADLATGTGTGLPGEASADKDSDSEGLTAIFSLVHDTVTSRVLGMSADLQFENLDLLLRDAKSRTTRWQIENARLVSTRSGVTLSAVLPQSDVLLQMELSDMEASATAVSVRVSSSLQQQAATSTVMAELQVQPDRIALDSIDIDDQSVGMQGKLEVVQGEHELRVDGALILRKLLPLQLSTRLGRGSEASDRRLFSYTPMAGRIPEDLVGEVRLHIDDISVGDAPMVDGNATVAFDHGVVALSADELSVLGGTASVELQVDSRTDRQTGVRLRADAQDLRLERLRQPDDDSPVFNKGQADVIVSLRGSGPSAGMIASSMDGYVLAALDDAEFNRRYSTAMDRGLVTWALERLSIISSRTTDQDVGARLSDPLAIDCAALRLYLNDGRAEVSNGAIVELPDNTVYSSGYIDLRSERLGFAFRTRRKSLFDWSAISVVRFLEVGGSLTSPRVSLNEGELVKQGVLTASSAAWGPLPSLVYKLGEAGLDNRDTMECIRSIN